MLHYLYLGEPPTVTVSKDLIVFNGTDVQLICTVSGSPLPNITWFKCKINSPLPVFNFDFCVFCLVNSNDNERILLDNSHGRFQIDNRTGVLSISNTIRDDSSVYECLAQNILGSAYAHTTLLVRRK